MNKDDKVVMAFAILMIIFLVFVFIPSHANAEPLELVPLENVHNGRTPLVWHIETGCIGVDEVSVLDCVEDVRAFCADNHCEPYEESGEE